MTETTQEGKANPLELITAGEIVENPTTGEIIDEINLVVISPVRAIYGLLYDSEEPFVGSETCKAIVDTLFVALNQWEKLSKHLKAEYDLYEAMRKIKRLEDNKVKLLEQNIALMKEKDRRPERKIY